MVYSEIRILDLLLILISAMIGISICNYLSLPMDWINSYRSILNLIIFKISIDLMSILRDWITSTRLINQKLITLTGGNIKLLASTLMLIIIAFLSVSMIPYMQIIVSGSNNFLPISLIALINLSLLFINQVSDLLDHSIMREFVFSAHLSYSIPLVIIGFAVNRAPGFFSLIFFPLFLFFLAIKMIDKVKNISENKNGIMGINLSIPRILGLHNILIAFGYFMWIMMGLLGLDTRIWVYPILTIPVGFLSILQTGKIINGRSKDFSQAYFISIFCNLSMLFCLAIALIRR